MPGTHRYEKLKSLLRDKITSGNYQPGDRFYSQNELMTKYGLSFSTVTRALNELELEGYLARKRGKGTFVQAVQTQTRESLPSNKRVNLFAPISPEQPLLSYSAQVYKHLELMHPESITLKFIPHGTRPDDLEPFVFKLEPTDAAVFLYPVNEHLEFIRKLATSQQVLVASDSPPEVECSSVVTPVTSASEAATAWLIQQGHERIAFVGAGSSALEQLLLKGYRNALKQASVPYREALVSAASATRNAGALADILARSTDGEFTAVFAAGTVTAISVLSELRVMDIEPGKSVAVVCYDDLERAESFHPAISTVAFPARSVAQEILRALAGGGADSLVQQSFIEPVFKPGASAATAEPMSH